MTLIFYSFKNLDPVNACSNPVGHGFNFPVMTKMVVITFAKD